MYRSISIMCLFLLHVFSNDINISCNKLCKDITENGNWTSKVCCFNSTEKERKMYFCGQPPPLPSLIAADYFIDNYTNSVGFKVTWTTLAEVAYEADGYFIAFQRDRSSVSDKVVIQTLGSPVMRKYEAIHFSYSYVPSEDNAIDPGHGYDIHLETLPSLCDERVSSKSISAYVSVPDCKSILKDTLNCFYKNQFFIAAENMPTTTLFQKERKNTHQPKIYGAQSSNWLLFLIVPIAFLVIAVVLLIYLNRRAHGKNKKDVAASKKLFVVISSQDTSDNTRSALLGDQMCCFFRNQGMEVTYTHWHVTELSQTNSIEWINDRVEAAHHVIVIVTSAALGLKELLTKSFESQPLLNPAFDPYTIMKKMMEHRIDFNSKFLLVSFDDDEAEIPSSFFHIKLRYCLPKDSVRLCKHIFLKNSVGRTLKSTLQNNILSPVGVSKSHDIADEVADTLPDLPTYITCKSIESSFSKQFDSGYLSSNNPSL